MEGVQNMMGKMMSGMMKPEDMPRMMQTMMDNMFKGMGAEDRIWFMQDMMPHCVGALFSGLDPEARKSVAQDILRRMTDDLKDQAKPPPARPLDLGGNAMISS